MLRTLVVEDNRFFREVFEGRLLDYFQSMIIHAAFGQALLQAESKALAEMIRSVKADAETPELQRKFFDDAAKPLETKPFVRK